MTDVGAAPPGAPRAAVLPPWETPPDAQVPQDSAWQPPPSSSWRSPAWQPPAPEPVAPPPTAPDSPADRSGTAPPGPAAGLALTAVALSFLVLGTTVLVSEHGGRTVSHVIDLDELWIGALYALVAGLAVGFVRHFRVRLRWTRGPALVSAVIGLAAGGMSGLTVVLHSQAVTGHVVIDPTIGLQLSEGSTARVLYGLLVPVVVAPVVEEIVFRGLLAESLLGRGLLSAAAVSAPAFWLWHWRLSVEACLYFVTFGVVTATVYRYRGLIGSMLAHAAFNGILVAIVISQLAAPARAVQAGALQLQVPASWTQQQTATPGALVLLGPSGAALEVLGQPVAQQVSTADLDALLRQRAAALSSSGTVAVSDIHEVELPAGEAVDITVTEGTHHVEVLELPLALVVEEVVVDDEGSRAAGAEAQQMLQSMRLAS